MIENESFNKHDMPVIILFAMICKAFKIRTGNRVTTVRTLMLVSTLLGVVLSYMTCLVSVQKKFRY